MRRYAKPIVVADDLNLLRGPTTGVVTLPRHLDWSGAADYDLDGPGRIVDLYRTVLIEATKPDDLHAASWPKSPFARPEITDSRSPAAMPFGSTESAVGQAVTLTCSPTGSAGLTSPPLLISSSRLCRQRIRGAR